MTGESAEFPTEFMEIRLRIQIEMKMEEKKRIKTILQRENLHKISQV